MQALFWDGQHLRLDTGYPTPSADETTAVVRVRLAGICATDLQILRGYMGFQGVPGHEFVGEVSAGPAELIGTRVVGEINFACGHCPVCAQGLSRHCSARRVMGILNADGCFAEYVRVPVTNLHPVPASITNEAAVFTEPLAAACEILEQVRVQPTDDVVVLGDGKLGALCAQVLSSAGAQVCVVGKHPHKLALLHQLGMATVLLSDWRPRLADIVVEATGSTVGLTLAMESIRPRGTLVLKSTVASTHTLSLAPLVINEITVVGSRCGRFPPALQALAHGHVTVAPLIDRVYPLAEGVQALAHAARPGTRKIVLHMF
jgi:threonine dehydrogenase-like Zn-dependent dehydrogenase